MGAEPLGWVVGSSRGRSSTLCPHTRGRTMLAFNIFGAKEIVVYVVVIVVIVIAAVWFVMGRRPKA